MIASLRPSVVEGNTSRPSLHPDVAATVTCHAVAAYCDVPCCCRLLCRTMLLPLTVTYHAVVLAVTYHAVAAYCDVPCCCRLLWSTMLLPLTVTCHAVAAYCDVPCCCHLLWRNMLLPLLEFTLVRPPIKFQLYVAVCLYNHWKICKTWFLLAVSLVFNLQTAH